MFWNIVSPEKARPNALPILPPPSVAIAMLGLIHTMEPFSVRIDSPGASWQIATPKGLP